MMSYLLLVVYSLVSSAGLVLLKLGSQVAAPVEIVGGKVNLHLNVSIVTGIILYGLSFLVYMYLISKNDLGYIIPVSTALVYIGIFVASFFIFKEAFTAIKIVGICLILGGLVLLNLGR